MKKIFKMLKNIEIEKLTKSEKVKKLEKLREELKTQNFKLECKDSSLIAKKEDFDFEMTIVFQDYEKFTKRYESVTSIRTEAYVRISEKNSNLKEWRWATRIKNIKKLYKKLEGEKYEY